MTKVKLASSRKTLMLIVGVVAVFAIGLAAITHADERGNRPERPEHEGRGDGLLNIAANVNVQSPNMHVRIGANDSVQVRGATVSATSTSGFTATTATPPLTFIVQTDSSTKFEIKGMGHGSIANVAVGDTVNFHGTAISGTTTSTITLKAAQVEDKTLHPKPPKPPKHATTTAATTTAVQIQIDVLTRLIARFQAMLDQLKLKFQIN